MPLRISILALHFWRISAQNAVVFHHFPTPKAACQSHWLGLGGCRFSRNIPSFGGEAVCGIRNETMASSHIDYSRVVSSMPPFSIFQSVHNRELRLVHGQQSKQQAPVVFSVASQVVLIFFLFFFLRAWKLASLFYIPARLFFVFFFVLVYF